MNNKTMTDKIKSQTYSMPKETIEKWTPAPLSERKNIWLSILVLAGMVFWFYVFIGFMYYEVNKLT